MEKEDKIKYLGIIIRANGDMGEEVNLDRLKKEKYGNRRVGYGNSRIPKKRKKHTLRESSDTYYNVRLRNRDTEMMCMRIICGVLRSDAERNLLIRKRYKCELNIMK